MSRDIDRDALRALAAQAAGDPGVPETVRRFLSAGSPLEEIVLDRFGRWWHEGGAFENERLSELFHRALRRTDAGTWLLEISPYTYPVRVEDAARFVRRVRWEGPQLHATLHGGATEIVPIEHLLTDGETFLGYAGDDGMLRRFVGDAWRALTDSIAEADGRWYLAGPGGQHPIALRRS